MRRVAEWIKDGFNKIKHLLKPIVWAIEDMLTHIVWIIEDLTISDIVALSVLIFTLFHLDLVWEALCVQGMVSG